jgi:hypothetical protein
MKSNAFRNAATLAFSVTFAGAMMAQSPSPSTPQTPQPTPQTTRPDTDRQDSLKGMIGQTVTLSGCLAREGASGGATTGTPGTPGTPGTQPTGTDANFVLTNVQVRSGAPTPGTDSPSPTGTPSAPRTAGAADMKVKLKASGTTDLSENVNKRVEVTGRLQEASSSMSDRPGTTPGSPGTPGAPGTPETGAPGAMSHSMDKMPELQVSNVRVLEQSCTPEQ